MSDTTYCYPLDYKVLKNKLGLRDAAELDRAERRLVVQRALEGIPTGNFDLKHLKAIHRHLFQDVYEWAGQTRTVEIAKGGSQFQFVRYIETGMADVYRRVTTDGVLKADTPDRFARLASEIIGDVNYVHPFRDGNGRAQLYYLKQLAAQAGYQLNLMGLMPMEWRNASRAAHRGNYEPLEHAIRLALENGL